MMDLYPLVAGTDFGYPDLPSCPVYAMNRCFGTCLVIVTSARVIFKKLVCVGCGELPNNYEYPVVCSLIINCKLNSLFKYSSFNA